MKSNRIYKIVACTLAVMLAVSMSFSGQFVFGTEQSETETQTEATQTESTQAVGMLLLDVQILPFHGSQFCHVSVSLFLCPVSF